MGCGGRRAGGLIEVRRLGFVCISLGRRYRVHGERLRVLGRVQLLGDVLAASRERSKTEPEQEEDGDRKQEVSILHPDSYQQAEPLGPLASLTFVYTLTMRRPRLGGNRPRELQDRLRKKEDGLQRHR